VTEGWRLCPAKVNLYLKVLARREDGYHDLVTVMQPLTLADELRLTPGQGLSLECRHPEVPSGPRNLVWRAAEAFGAATGQVPQVHLELVKKIPVAAGLGGGSSDAAGTLLALNDRAGTPLSAEKLHELAAALGADVPFFLQRSPAVGRGIGTVLSPLDLPPAAWDGDHPEAWVANDLETVTLSRYPELRELLGELALAGARAQGMSGSGPTLFGLFLEAEAARAAARRLRQNFSGWITVTRGLTQAEGEATGRVKDEWSENF